MNTATQNTVKGVWSVDNAHSGVQFTVDHLVISQVNGNFTDFSGSISNETGVFEDSKFHFEIGVNSISTGNKMRDDHLLSDDFFNAEAYPKIIFTSSSVTKVSDDKFEIHGNMVIRDVTKELTFSVKLGGTAQDGYGNTKMGLKASATINRFDYKLKWNQLTEVGGVTVGKEVDITANLQFALNQ